VMTPAADSEVGLRLSEPAVLIALQTTVLAVSDDAVSDEAAGC
jgi:hypothetical protein